jgi:hypothetical protein
LRCTLREFCAWETVPLSRKISLEQRREKRNYTQTTGDSEHHAKISENAILENAILNMQPGKCNVENATSKMEH